MQPEPQQFKPTASSLLKSKLRQPSLLDFINKSAQLSSFNHIHQSAIGETNSELEQVPEEEDVDGNNFLLNRIHRLNSRKELKVRSAVFDVMRIPNHCGCLWKRKNQILCVLEGQLLIAGSNGTDSQRLFWNFDTTPFHIKCNPKGFQIEPQNRQDCRMSFYTDNEDKARQWGQIITKCIENGLGRKYTIGYTLADRMLLEREYVLERDFVNRCDSGDIILFNDKHAMAKVQRFLTNSEYDHVGIVLKNCKGQVLIFQANSGSGVSTIFWDWQLVRQRWYRDINQIAWRKLNVDRNKVFIDDLEHFISGQINKCFGINLYEVLTVTTSIAVKRKSEREMMVTEQEEGLVVDEGKQQKGKEQEKEKTEPYFCSQLVAKTYKTMGLIDQKKSSKKYWPKDFSDRGNLKLIKGELERERVIVFHEDLLRENYPFYDLKR